MKKVLTIQHTQSVHHTNGMVGSWTDWELTELGKKQAENIGRRLSAELSGQAYQIYSSDLKRAKQTAEPLARYMGVEIEYLEKLREHNIGIAAGKSKQWGKANSTPVNTFDDRLFPGAESQREFWSRVTDLYQDIMADEAKNIILVSHGGTLAILHQVWLGKDIHYCRNGAAGSVSFMELTDDGECLIKRWNDISYLEES